MKQSETAKIFENGRSQAVRLPAKFRFTTKEVFIRQDKITGDVILSIRPENWDVFLKLLSTANVDDDFLSKNERKQNLLNRDAFIGWQE